METLNAKLVLARWLAEVEESLNPMKRSLATFKDPPEGAAGGTVTEAGMGERAEARDVGPLIRRRGRVLKPGGGA